MSLISLIKSDQLTARKSRDSLRASLLTTLIGESEMVGKNAGREVTDMEVTAVAKKFLKGIEESIAAMKDVSNENGTADRYVNLLKEQSILQHLLPKQMTEVELTAAVKEIVDDMRARASQVNMGMVMGALKIAFEGEYDGKMASAVVKAALAV